MSRRRQKNNLLPKMIGIAVVINAILLPILAQMGVFKANKQHLMRVTMIKLPPLEKKKEAHKAPPKKRIPKIKPHIAPKPGHQSVARAPKANPNQPKVVAAGKPSVNGDGDIVNNGTGKTGLAPSASTTASNAGVSTQPPTQPAPPSVTEPTPAPFVAPSPPPHDPVVVAAAPLNKPQPDIPDDLRNTELHSQFEALFSVHADGTASVKIKKSTGNDKLDALALDAAKRWTFRPATKDGAPVDSYLNVEMDFDVG